jgi:ribosome-associated protein
LYGGVLFCFYVTKAEEKAAILHTYTQDIKTPESMKALILESLDSDKAEEIDTIDLRGQTAIADYMVIASGRSSRQVAALADKLYDRLKAAGYGDIRIEGKEQANWIIVDAGDIIVHLFRPEVREFYNIEGMWTVFPSLHEISTPAP